MDMTGQSRGVCSMHSIYHRRSFILRVEEEETVYFFWPVALLKVSVTAWPALLRPCEAESTRPPPSFWAESPPERVESPTFWVADLLPSKEVLVDEGGVMGEERTLTRLDGRCGLVAESGDGLAGLVNSRLLRVGSH